jgi:hypothetical protein
MAQPSVPGVADSLQPALIRAAERWGFAALFVRGTLVARWSLGRPSRYIRSMR